MSQTDRSKALLEVFRQGLQRHGEQQTRTQLGDRSAYLGLSDLARYADCPRAAVAAKLLQQDTSLENLLTLQRGHWFEDGIAGCLGARSLRFMRQVEISHSPGDVPIRAHLDMTLVWDAPHPAVRVLEIKSMETLPKEPYPSHERQIQGQVALLEEFWDAPVFTLKRGDGTTAHTSLNFPELCRRELGMKIPDAPEEVSVEGWLLCLSMRDARAFGPYLPDGDALESLRLQAVEYWATLQNVRAGATALNDIPYARGFYPLCVCCRFSADCPRFPQGDSQPQWEPALSRLECLKQRRTVLDGEIREIENVLKLAHQLSGTADWIGTGGHRFRVSQTAGRTVLDRAALKEELEAIFLTERMDDIDVDALLARHERAGAPSSRLTINAVN